MTLPLGKVYGTMGALVAFAGALDEDLDTYLVWHANGDWGEVDNHDRKANEYAVVHGLRVLSSYTLRTGQKIWIITEADRSTTTNLVTGGILTALSVLGKGTYQHLTAQRPVWVRRNSSWSSVAFEEEGICSQNRSDDLLKFIEICGF